METSHKAYWALGLIVVLAANASGCLSCVILSLAIAYLLASIGYKKQAGMIMLGGFVAPLATSTISPGLPPVVRAAVGLTLAVLLYLSARKLAKNQG